MLNCHGFVSGSFSSQRIKRPRRTTTTDENGKRSVLPTVEFMAVSDFVIQKAAEQGVYIPAPNEDVDYGTGEIRQRAVA